MFKESQRGAGQGTLAGKAGESSLLRAGLLQAFFFIAFGAGIPFFSLHFKHILVLPDGTPAHHLIGFIFLLNGAIGVFSTPIMGFISDQFKIGHRLLALCGGLAFLSGLMLALPGLGSASSWSLSRRFGLLLAGYALNGLFFRPIIPLIDTETLNVLHHRFESGTDYGRIRLFGSAGWILSVSAVGWILSRSGNVMYAILCYAAGFAVLTGIAMTGFRAKLERVRIPWEYLKRDSYFRRFLLFAALNSFGLTSSFIYTGYFMEDLRASYLVIGLAIGLSALPEIPLMYHSRRFIEDLGNRVMIVIGSSLMTIKLVGFVLVAVSGKPLLFIPVQLLHGVGWTFHYVGMVNLADTRAHRDLRATYQGLLHVFMLIGGTLGNFVGPVIMSGLDSTWLMAINAGVLILAIVYFVTAVREYPSLNMEEM